jgi:hypothetical protein
MVWERGAFHQFFKNFVALSSIKTQKTKIPSILLTVAAQVHLQTKIHSKLCRRSTSLNHLLLHHRITLKLKHTLQVKSSPSLVQEKAYPSLVQPLATRRRLAAYQVTSQSSLLLLLLLLSSSSDSSKRSCLHLQTLFKDGKV